jgi:hypothetical protein
MWIETWNQPRDQQGFGLTAELDQSFPKTRTRSSGLKAPKPKFKWLVAAAKVDQEGALFTFVQKQS